MASVLLAPAWVPQLAGASSAQSATSTLRVTDPTAGHVYRHGALPLVLGTSAAPAQLSPSAPVAPSGNTTARRAASGGKLRYGGGDPGTGVGVVTGNPRVYLVFWGPSTTPNWNNATGDPDGAKALLQQFFNGLGTNHELWSGTALQYCQGVPTGSTSCPTSGGHVPYPVSDVLAGTWIDTVNGYPANLAPTGGDLAAEAERAATHFGNTTQASNLNAQYVIASPSSADPDGWLDPVNGYCAYHDNTADPTIDGSGPAAGPNLAFTNLPYVADAGPDCGAGSVNNPGTTDGVTIAEGHEYYETLTDPYPSLPNNGFVATGWTDRKGGEIGDKCEFLQAGQPGGPADITLATGTFAVQGMWANNSGRRGHCVLTEPTITIAKPARPRARVGTPASLQISATDGAPGATLSYGATGLPAGLSINPSTGLISGTPTTAGRSNATVVVSDNLGFSNSVGMVWRVGR